VPITSLVTLRQLHERHRVEDRWLARGVVGLGILALTLAGAGLYGVSPVDPVAFASATALLLVTMVLASLAPARRAARVDPMVVLRHE
jgi:ABC-type antimicrobial peptide transport system permease subunit